VILYFIVLLSFLSFAFYICLGDTDCDFSFA